MPAKKLTFALRPNPPLHRWRMAAASRQSQPNKVPPSVDTSKVRLQLTPNADPTGNQKFNPKRHEAQVKELRKNETDTTDNLGHTVTPLSDTTGSAGWDAWSIAERYRCYDTKTSDTASQDIDLGDVMSYSGQQLFQDRLYLFNVIVALEWIPSRRTLQQLIAGFQNASDFLYDATDGYMAFGQVVFGGMDLMQGADIQLLASNRYHPRSWVNGLNDLTKFTPIRIGRGIWHKNNHVSTPWNEPEGYRAIVHEWGHYALGLLDEYLDQSRPQVPNRPRLVIPKLSIASESIMATLEGTSEIVPQQRRGDTDLQNKLRDSLSMYPGVDFTGPVNEGPFNLPIVMPGFATTNELLGTGSDVEEQLIDVDDIALDHCWVYILREDANQLRVIAQGSLDARSQPVPDAKLAGNGFWLYGYREGDKLLFIGSSRASKKLVVERRELAPADAAGEKRQTILIGPATPSSIPVVTVMPEPIGDKELVNDNTPRSTPIRVRIAGTSLPDEVWVCPIGQEQAFGPFVFGKNDGTWTSDQITVPHLDGQVVLRWKGDAAQYMVYDYSQGGGPNSHVLAPDPPITAGSSEGNVMFFFRFPPEVEKTNDRQSLHYDKNIDYSRIRMVTTRNYGGFERASEEGEPRSYLFSAAWNKTIPADDLSPTLVLNFDREALEADDKKSDGRLIISWYHEASRQWIDTDSYTPKGAFFAALELKQAPKDGKPGFDPSQPDDTIAHYRLFLVPK